VHYQDLLLVQNSKLVPRRWRGAALLRASPFLRFGHSSTVHYVTPSSNFKFCQDDVTCSNVGAWNHPILLLNVLVFHLFQLLSIALTNVDLTMGLYVIPEIKYGIAHLFLVHTNP